MDGFPGVLGQVGQPGHMVFFYIKQLNKKKFFRDNLVFLELKVCLAIKDFQAKMVHLVPQAKLEMLVIQGRLERMVYLVFRVNKFFKIIFYY